MRLWHWQPRLQKTVATRMIPRHLCSVAWLCRYTHVGQRQAHLRAHTLRAGCRVGQSGTGDGESERGSVNIPASTCQGDSGGALSHGAAEGRPSIQRRRPGRRFSAGGFLQIRVQLPDVSDTATAPGCGLRHGSTHVHVCTARTLVFAGCGCVVPV